MQWALANKMIIDEDKTKEIVFRQGDYICFHLLTVLTVELVQHAKLLGVIKVTCSGYKFAVSDNEVA